jgi:hypothetical protein
LKIADCRLPIELTIDDWGLEIGLSSVDLIDDCPFRIALPIVTPMPNPQSSVQSAIINPVANPQSPIVNTICSLQSAIGNG